MSCCRLCNTLLFKTLIPWITLFLYSTTREQFPICALPSDIHTLMGQSYSKRSVEKLGSNGSGLSSAEALSKLSHVAYMAKSPNEEGQNLLHCAVSENDTDFIVGVLQFATKHRLLVEEMILYADGQNMNSLQYAIANANIESVKVLLRQLSDKNARIAVKSKNYLGCNSVQLVVMHCPDSSRFLERIFAKVGNSYSGLLIDEKNAGGENALQVAASLSKNNMLFYLQRRASQQSFSGSCDWITASNSLLLITWALENDDIRLLKTIVRCRPETVENWLNKNASFELSSCHIKIMAPCSKTYIIPPLQTKAKKHAFICFNPTDRHNALDEAAELTTAFADTNYTIHCCVWTSYAQLRSWISDEVDRIASQASFLALFIMSHGRSGTLGGDGECDGSISDVIDETRRGLPIHIPLLVGIQACQTEALGVNEVEAAPHPLSDAEVSNRGDINHVILRANNCVLLMATIYGGMAYRQNFTSAFSKELRDANNTPILDVFAAAQRRMKSHPHPRFNRQQAEMRVSGDAVLCL